MTESNFYQLGRVSHVTITMPDGQDLVINAPVVTVDIETETMDHFSLSGGRAIVDKEVTIREEKKVSIQVEDDGELGDKLTRLIRED